MSLIKRSDDSAVGREYLRRANGFVRKTTLGLASINHIMKLPVASREFSGRPISASIDLPPATDLVREVLRQDSSMAAWIAREAVVALDELLGLMDTPWGDAVDVAMDMAGLMPGPALNPERCVGVPAEIHKDMLGLANCVTSVFFAFDRPGGAPGNDRTYYEHLFTSPARPTRLVAHEIVAWSGVVIGRLLHTGLIPEVLWMSDEFETVPSMDTQGWYPNPWNMGEVTKSEASFQRYWDGIDWTDQVRLRDGRSWSYETRSMFRAPDN